MQQPRKMCFKILNSILAVLAIHIFESKSTTTSLDPYSCLCEKIEGVERKADNFRIQLCGYELNALNNNNACEEQKVYICAIHDLRSTPDHFPGCETGENCVLHPKEEFRRICLHPKGEEYSYRNCDCPPAKEIAEMPHHESISARYTARPFCGYELNERNKNHACREQKMIHCAAIGEEGRNDYDCNKCLYDSTYRRNCT